MRPRLFMCRSLTYPAIALILLFTLSACGIFPKSKTTEVDGRTVEEIYAQAKEQMDNVNYEKAIKLFDTLQARYPYGRYAQQAQLESAYAYYKQDELDQALTTIERFIKQYPNNPYVDYAYYLKGLINFNEELGLFGDVVQNDMSERDPRGARDSFDTFKELVTLFPDSKYTPDAKLRMQYLINTLARYETRIAAYYLRRGAYIAAIGRANTVITEFPGTWPARDALQIMVQAYDALGMKELREDTQRMLELNVSQDGVRPRTKESPENKAPWWQFWK